MMFRGVNYEATINDPAVARIDEDRKASKFFRFKRWIRSCAVQLWPLGVIALLCTVFFWDVFLLPANEILGGEDLTGMFWHWSQFVTSSVQHNRLPLWNPYLFSGTPFVANPQPALFYPATWLVHLMPTSRAMGLIIVLHVWIAGAGMYAWMRSEQASKGGALFAGTVFFGSIVNSSLVGLAERQREVATFRAMGYGPWWVGGLFLRENVLVNIFGTLLGLPFGYFLVHLTSLAYEQNDVIRLPVVSAPWVWVATVAFSMVFTLFAHGVVQWRVYHMNYLDALNVKE